MNQDQKEFYIKKIKKYNEELKEVNRNTTIFIMAVAFSALLITGVVLYEPLYDSILESWANKVKLIISYMISGGLSLLSIKSLINSIIRKAGLENRIIEIEEILELNGIDIKLSNKDKNNKGK